MKKIIFILLSVFIISACYKTEIYKPELMPGFFHSECSIGDSLFYYMNCNVNYEYADIQFIRKKVKTINEYHYLFDNTEYTIKKDTVITLMEDYKYYGDLFKYNGEKLPSYPAEFDKFLFPCILRLGYTDKYMTANIIKIQIVNGKDTDLAIDKPVYAIHLSNIRESF